MADNRFKAAALACFAVLATAAPSAAEDKLYLEEYQAYNAAMASGDVEAALRHGYAAWQAAEAALGDDGLTAILAYNYGALAIYSETETAYQALLRADTLVKAGAATLPEKDLALYLAYTDFKINDGNRGKANALRDVLEQLVAENIAPSRDTANMWFELASADVHNQRYRDTLESAIQAEAQIATVFPENYRSRASALMFYGIAEAMPMPRTEKRVIRAVEAFRRARDLFPPQDSIEKFDGVLAQSLAWEAAAHAAYISSDFSAKRYPEDTSEKSLFFGEQKTAEECKCVWEERDPPDYPNKALFRGYLGAVVIGYRFGDDTNVHDVQILAEVPTGTFSEAVLEEVKKWRLKAPLVDDPACRDNQITQVTFVIN